MCAAKARWPEWGEVVAAWDGHSVPEVEITDFQIGKHFHPFPWLDRRTGEQLHDAATPHVWTARALCAEFPAMSRDAQIAFKVLAFCWMNDIRHFDRVLAQVPSFDQRRWWAPQAVYVLPPVNMVVGESLRSLPKFDEVTIARAWKNIVDESAQKWRLIAETWAVIRIPRFMAHGSPELLRWNQHVEAESERREVQEYERLKAKYGNRNAPV